METMRSIERDNGAIKTGPRPQRGEIIVRSSGRSRRYPEDFDFPKMDPLVMVSEADEMKMIVSCIG